MKTTTANAQTGEPNRYANLSNEEFQTYVHKIAAEKGVAWLMSLGDVYSIVAEELNNEVLERWKQDNPAPTYTVFARDWWREATPADGRWPDNLVPLSGAPRETLAEGLSYSEAREMCAEYNAENEPGRYQRKAEFERE